MGTIRYANAAGSNTAPYDTVAKGATDPQTIIDLAVAGDTNLYYGTFTPGAVLDFDTNSGDLTTGPITHSGCNASGVVDGTLAVFSGGSSLANLFKHYTAKNAHIIDYFEIKLTTSNAFINNAANYSTNWIVRRCYIHNCGGNVFDIYFQSFICCNCIITDITGGVMADGYISQLSNCYISNCGTGWGNYYGGAVFGNIFKGITGVALTLGGGADAAGAIGNIFEACGTGISIRASYASTIFGNKFTNCTTAINLPAGAYGLENQNYFYNNTAKFSVAATAKLISGGASVDAANDGYIDKAGGNFMPSTPIAGKYLSIILNSLNTNYIIPGLGANPDFPAISNVAPDDTVDGATGTIDLPSIANVLNTDTLRDVTGEFNEAARNKFATGTTVADLATGKSVKIQNVDYNGTSDKIYSAAEEAARNQGAATNIIKSGGTIKQLNIDYAGTVIEETHTANQVLHSAGGNFIDENLANEKITDGTIWGLGGEGSLVVPTPEASLLTVTVLTSTSALLNFPGNINTEYAKVYYKLVASPTYTQFGGNVTIGSSIVTGLTPDSVYMFKIVAHGAGGLTDESNVVTKTTRATMTPIEARRTLIIDWVKEVTTYANEAIIWSQQNMPRPTKPYVTLKASTFKTINREFVASPDNTGSADISTHKEFTLSINHFPEDTVDPIEKMLDLQDSLNKSKYIELFKTENLVFVDVLMGPTDTSIKLDTKFEPRASMDLLMRMPWNIEDADQGFIDIAEITGKAIDIDGAEHAIVIE